LKNEFDPKVTDFGALDNQSLTGHDWMPFSLPEFGKDTELFCTNCE
jgi:hypothetical protein